MRRHSFLAALASAAVLATGLVAAPAQAAAAPAASSDDYVALGDSYSAGTGGGTSNGACFGSSNGFPTLWDQREDFASFLDVSCGGALIDDVLEKQVQKLSASTDVVTITIGGNDTGWLGTVINCSYGSDRSCTSAIDEGYLTFPEIGRKLDATYAAIKTNAPNAEVYVLGYPRLFDETRYCFGGLSLNKRKALNIGSDKLNVLTKERATAAGFTFVDVQPQFQGHGICARDAWLNDSFLRDGVGAYHPDATGYREGYLPALVAATS